MATLARLLGRLIRIQVPPRRLEDRLANLPCDGAPVSQPVEIRWSPQAIPCVTAGTLPDLAIGVGMVHAHLRLAQLEFMRRIAAGRIAELVGALGIDLDIALRTVDVARAVPAILAGLPPATRAWLEGYLAGINHVIAAAPELPPEFVLLDLPREPWTLADLLGIARLAAADITWGLSVRLLQLRERMPPSEWAALWPQLRDGGLPEPRGPLATHARGSNSAAVPGSRSASGRALIASDPHVSLQLPSIWLACGLAAPGFHAAGLMVPGLPTIAIGRNARIAWGATNLHAASSVLVDLDAESRPGITERRVEIAVRGGRPHRATLRDSRFGPVISDVKLFGLERPTALAWVGHRASDETTAMLGVNLADDFRQFRAALRGSAVQGYSFTYADAAGRTGVVRAAHVPARRAPPADLIEPGGLIEELAVLADADADGPDDASQSCVVSANEDPQTAVPAGFFFAPADRADRLRELLDRPQLQLEDLQALQRDVASGAARRLRDRLAARARRLGVELPPEVLCWDGCYSEESAGALGFEILFGETAARLLERTQLAALTTVWTHRGLMAARLDALPDAACQPALAAASRLAARALERGRTWGDAHRMMVRHPLAAVPFFGRKFGAHEFGAPGSSDTVHKTGHGLLRLGRHRGRHRVSYGASARHVAGFADLDDNFVVLPGGQDGWPGSDNASDQMATWRAGGYFRLPLRAESIAALHDRVSHVLPGRAASGRKDFT